jgi:hypothetical protein
MSVSTAPGSLLLELVRIPLFPETGVASAVPSSTGQAFEALRDSLEVRGVGNVVDPVPAKCPGLQATLMVHGLGDRLQMIGIDAPTDPASVIYLEAARYGSFVMDPECTGSDRSPVLPSTHDPVAISVYGTPPDPAPSLTDLVPGPVVDEGFGHLHEGTGGVV